MFQVTEAGFKMKFPNGFELSVHFGEHNYCDNRHDPEGDGKPSSTAEIRLHNGNEGQVSGYLDTDQVAGAMSAASKLQKGMSLYDAWGCIEQVIQV